MFPSVAARQIGRRRYAQFYHQGSPGVYSRGIRFAFTSVQDGETNSPSFELWSALQTRGGGGEYEWKETRAFGWYLVAERKRESSNEILIFTTWRVRQCRGPSICASNKVATGAAQNNSF